MQISGVSSSSYVPVGKTNSSPAGKPATDEAKLNFSAGSFFSLVKSASDMPEVRGEVVDAYKSRIQSGDYPSQETIANLVNVIGGSVLQAAAADSSS